MWVTMELQSSAAPKKKQKKHDMRARRKCTARVCIIWQERSLLVFDPLERQALLRSQAQVTVAEENTCTLGRMNESGHLSVEISSPQGQS